MAPGASASCCGVGAAKAGAWRRAVMERGLGFLLTLLLLNRLGMKERGQRDKRERGGGWGEGGREREIERVRDRHRER